MTKKTANDTAVIDEATALKKLDTDADVDSAQGDKPPKPKTSSAKKKPATKVKETTPKTDENLVSSKELDEDLRPTYFDENFGATEDFGGESRYFHVSFDMLDKDLNRSFGAMPVYSRGMFNIDSFKQDIINLHDAVDVIVSGWKELESREIFNATYASEAVEGIGEGVSFYHIHYILINGAGGQVSGTTPAQTTGIINLPSVMRYLADTYETQPTSIVIRNWQKLDSVEDFAQLNSFTINEPTPQQ